MVEGRGRCTERVTEGVEGRGKSGGGGDDVQRDLQ